MSTATVSTAPIIVISLIALNRRAQSFNAQITRIGQVRLPGKLEAFCSVISFSKLNQTFLGYFDPINSISDNKNNHFYCDLTYIPAETT